MKEVIIKPVKERDSLDLLELTLQLHARGMQFPSKEMHDAYIEARAELEKRLTPEWISVETDLPEIGEYVLLHNTEGAILVGRVLNNGWGAMFADGEKLMGELTATHWMPLPSAPGKVEISQDELWMEMLEIFFGDFVVPLSKDLDSSKSLNRAKQQFTITRKGEVEDQDDKSFSIILTSVGVELLSFRKRTGKITDDEEQELTSSIVQRILRKLDEHNYSITRKGEENKNDKP